MSFIGKWTEPDIILLSRIKKKKNSIQEKKQLKIQMLNVLAHLWNVALKLWG
jgi:hypothetical protein